MPTKDVTLKVRTDTSQAQKGFASLESQVTKIGGALGIAFGSQQIIQLGYEAVQLSAKAEGVRTAFSKLNDPFLLENLRRATRGTVSDLELMQISMRASNFKIPLDVLAKGLEFAQKRARQTGQDVDYLANSFVDGLGRKSSLVLDNLGISASELQKEIKKVGDFSVAAGNIVDRELGKMGDVALTTADKFAQISAELENIKVKIGDVLLDTVDVSKDILDWWYNGPGIIYKQLINLITSSNSQTLKMISPHQVNQGNINNNGGGFIDPRVAEGMARRSQSGYTANRGTLDYDTNIIFRQMIESQREAFSKANIGGLLGLRGVEMPIKPEIMIDESELRESFREFDVIANESARTLFNAFSQAWNDIFGEANSLFEQLLQNISMGLFDLFAQDVSKSIFESLIPGGGLLSGLGDALGLGKRSSILVQIGESQVQMATAKVVPNAIAEQQRRRILD